MIRTRTRSTLIAACAAVTLTSTFAVLVTTEVASAAPIRIDVDSTFDMADALPGDGLCAVPGGACTLRAAVMEANAIGGSDETEIWLPSGDYSLTLPETGDASGGSLDIKQNTSLIGAGDDDATRITPVAGSSIFDVHGGALHARWLRLHKSQGASAISVKDGSLTVLNSMIDNNSSAGTKQASAVDAVGSQVSLVGVTVRYNKGDVDLAPATIRSRGGELHIQGSTIAHNDNPEGAAVMVEAHDGSQAGATVVSSGLRDNVGAAVIVSASDGGSHAEVDLVDNLMQRNDVGVDALAVLGATAKLNVYQIDFSDNGRGMHIRSGVDASVAHSTFNDHDSSALVNSSHGSVVIETSTIANNTTSGAGGGILNGGVMTLVNSTVSGNSSGAGWGGGGIYNEGILFGEDADMTIINSTIVNNVNNSSQFTGGGIDSGGSSSLKVTNSIVANNIGGDCEIHPIPRAGGISGGHNLEGDGTCDFNGPGDLLGDPKLEPLSQFGFFKVHRPLAGSPVLRAGDDAVCQAAPVRGFDQRGAERTAPCDIGALEESFDGDDGGDGDPQLPTFADVPGSNVHAVSIGRLAALGITKGGPGGRPSNEYGPDLQTSRAQMASFVARLADELGVTLPTSPPDAFDDDDGVHELAINQLAAIGVIGGNGESGRTYGSDRTISREEMASFLNGLIEAKTGQRLSSSTDAFPDDGSSPHQADINGLASVQIVLGRDDGGYHPTDTVQRDSMASYLIRTLDHLNDT